MTFVQNESLNVRARGCPGLSESSLGAHSFCWFCHDAAHMSVRHNHYALI